jgi:leader peptidase (prepilin peptidase)/N-methyltransferase
MILIFVFIMGAIVGSFLNVCIYRLPRKESLISPGSHCPSCGKPIGWFDNIPVLSFLMLGGKCRKCRKPFGARYFIVELLSGAVAALVFLHFGFGAKFFIFSAFFFAFIVISFIDLATREIPDEITLPGIVIGLLLATAYPPLLGKTANFGAFLDSLSGIIAGGAGLYLLGAIGSFIFKREAMGGGDIKLLAMIGAFLGFKLTLFTFFLAPFFGSAVGIIVKIRRGDEIIPYGPYLSLAAAVAVFYGDTILRKIFSFY